MTDLLKIRDLIVEYKTRRGTARAVDRVSLDLVRNKTLGLAGESGCGKSTLGRAIMGIVSAPGKVVGGKILLDLNEDITYRRGLFVKDIHRGLKAHRRGWKPSLRREGSIPSGYVDVTKLKSDAMRALRGSQIAYIFQDPMTSLNPMLSIGDHFVQIVRAHSPDTSKEEAIERGKEVLEGLGILPERVTDYPHQFSGGMRQRVMIGLGLVLRPSLLISDEPTTSLDVIVEAQILEQMAELKEKYRLTMILITHNLGVLAQTADSVAIMYTGRMMEIADTEALFESPQHPYTQALLQSVPDVTKPDKKLEWIPGAPPDLIDPPPGCMYNPRCPFVMKVCRTDVPPLIESETGGLVACHLYGGLSIQ
ncbi:MAG: ABC transporter ATP-binding protein [Candidatus Thorarchaeota archaeon]